ncbi:MAG: nuclear transport factor 2 family protein [Ferruginibacter sp.]
MKKQLLFILAICTWFAAKAQPASKDSIHMILLNQQIDDYVVAQNVQALEGLYADDFVFSHGSGRVEGKTGWMSSVKKGSFTERKHDSVTVEMHGIVAIVRGKLTVVKKAKEKTDRYHLKYVRVYASRNNQWQMISHFTFTEWHE